MCASIRGINDRAPSLLKRHLRCQMYDTACEDHPPLALLPLLVRVVSIATGWQRYDTLHVETYQIEAHTCEISGDDCSRSTSQ